MFRRLPRKLLLWRERRAQGPKTVYFLLWDRTINGRKSPGGPGEYYGGRSFLSNRAGPERSCPVTIYSLKSPLLAQGFDELFSFSDGGLHFADQDGHIIFNGNKLVFQRGNGLGVEIMLQVQHLVPECD